MRLFGVTYTRREMESRVARIEAVGGVRRIKLAEGPEAEVELVQVRTGAGLAYTLNASRCLDIALAEYCGVPISWHSPAGDVHPAYYDSEGAAWLRTAAGGLLMTCGLTQVGSACVEDGQSLGVHGRAHHTPARHVAAEGRWNGDEYDVRVAGVVEETALFGDSLRLTREIRSRLGESRLAIRDVVENVGFAPAPLMVLYHFNFGFPLMDKDTQVALPSRKIVPRESDLTLDGLDAWQPPTPNFRERVYYHEELKTDSKGWTAVTVRNPHFPLAGGTVPLAVHLRWSTANLPRFAQWRMPGTGVYVLGIEPANCHVEGRSAERKRGTLVMLEPGKSAAFDLELDVKSE
jgi:hypothetical protein